MDINDQVCTLEQAKRLKELGVAQGTSFLVWLIHMGHKPHLAHKSKYRSTGYIDFEQGGEYWCEDGHELYSAFTIAELGAAFPESIELFFDFSDYVVPKTGKYILKMEEWFWDEHGKRVYAIHFRYNNNINISFPKDALFFSSQAQCRAAMLIHLLESNIITAEEVNQRLTPVK